jgi:LPS-assembly lipoprotein
MSLSRPSFAPILAAFTSILAGCGFHLRGDVTYPPAMAVTYIDAKDTYTPFYQKLKAALRENGIKVTADPNGASAVVHILHDESGQRVSSVSARNTPNEYDVYYIIRYSLDLGGKEAVAAQHLALNREYTYDETLVLGEGAQSEVLRQALAADLVGVVTRKLSSAK